MELEQVWEAAVPPGRKRKPSTHTSTWERKNEQSRRKIKHSPWKGVCKGRESFVPRPLKRGTSHCSLIQRGETGKVSVCVWEREKVKALLNPQNIMMTQEALREVNGGECVSGYWKNSQQLKVKWSEQTLFYLLSKSHKTHTSLILDVDSRQPVLLTKVTRWRCELFFWNSLSEFSFLLPVRFHTRPQSAHKQQSLSLKKNDRLTVKH